MSNRVSLVLATMGRTTEVSNFLQSLNDQKHHDIQLIIVDQNPDDRLVPVIAAADPSLNIQHVRYAPGLSRSRNEGLRHATGDIIAFPDDDCWYGPGLLDTVTEFFTRNPDVHILTGILVDEKGQQSTLAWDKTAGPLERRNIMRRAISASIFIRSSVLERVPGFNPQLGVGSGTEFGAGEETDFLINALDHGYSGYFDPAVRVGHPNKQLTLEAGVAFRYGAGLGALLRLHRYPVSVLLKVIVKPAAAAVACTLVGRFKQARYYVHSLRGRYWGYRNANRVLMPALPGGAPRR